MGHQEVKSRLWFPEFPAVTAATGAVSPFQGLSQVQFPRVDGPHACPNWQCGLAPRAVLAGLPDFRFAWVIFRVAVLVPCVGWKTG